MLCIEFNSPIKTAGFEQEIENLKQKLAACVRENSDLQEELSEANHIKVRPLDFVDLFIL